MYCTMKIKQVNPVHDFIRLSRGHIFQLIKAIQWCHQNNVIHRGAFWYILFKTDRLHCGQTAADSKL